MIDLEKAKKEFLNYTSNYDQNDPAIQRKIEHSLRTMEVSKEIAENLKMTKEEIELATLIGLLHDIGRFEQRRRFGTYIDKLSIDHGDMGAYILEKDNYIRKYIETDKYDKIIFEAIKNHNKYTIDTNLSKEENHFAEIIKDADKLDIFYLIVEKFHGNKEEIENSEISEEYMQQLRENVCIYRKTDQTALDEYALITSFIFDMYFRFSVQTVRRENYINRFFLNLKFKKEKTKEQVKELLDIAEEYLLDPVGVK